MYNFIEMSNTRLGIIQERILKLQGKCELIKIQQKDKWVENIKEYEMRRKEGEDLTSLVGEGEKKNEGEELPSVKWRKWIEESMGLVSEAAER